MQESDSCFCSADSVGDRAPTEAEFSIELNHTVISLDLPNVDAVVGVEESDREVTSPTPLPTSSPTVLSSSTATPTATQPPSLGGVPFLEVEMKGPGAAFVDQQIDFIITITNTGDETALNILFVDELPTEGSLVSSDPPGMENANPPTTITIELGDLAPGDTVEVTVRWQTPNTETTITNRATVIAENTQEAVDEEEVAVGTATTVTGGVTSAGTGLRNRADGTIEMVDIPEGASVTRAVLVWALLYTTSIPSNRITFAGTQVAADLTATISNDLCWGDSQTIGYAADVTGLVSGNGSYEITDVVNGIIREDSNPVGVLPYTDGASLFVFYGGPGIENKVFSDFTYSAETGGSNERTLTGITSAGGTSILHLAGPDGQTPGNEQVRITVTGSGTINLDNSWDGSAPQAGPDFPIGNLWDNDIIDVSSILPAGQATLEISLGGGGGDCTGLSAVVLQVEQ